MEPRKQHAMILEAAQRISSLARRGETVEVHLASTATRTRRLIGGRATATASDVAGLLRFVADGREVFASFDAASHSRAEQVLALCRQAVAAAPLSTDATEGDEAAHAGPTCSPLAPLACSCPRTAEEQGSAPEDLKDRLTEAAAGALTEALVEEKSTAVVFVSSAGTVRSYTRALARAKVTTGADGAPGTSTVHACHPGRLDLPTLVSTARWSGQFAAVRQTGRRPSVPHTLAQRRALFMPAAAASLVHLITFHLLDSGDESRDGSTGLSLCDDPHAAGGPFASAFDEEGVASVPVVLWSAATGRGSLVSRHGWLGARPIGPGTGLTGHARRRDLDVMPTPQPTNVRLTGPRPPAATGWEGTVVYGIDGLDKQAHHAGARLSVALLSAHVRDGRVQGLHEPVRLTGTAYELLHRITALGPPLYYQPGSQFATSASWMVVDTTA